MSSVPASMQGPYFPRDPLRQGPATPNTSPPQTVRAGRPDQGLPVQPVTPAPAITWPQPYQTVGRP